MCYKKLESFEMHRKITQKKNKKNGVSLVSTFPRAHHKIFSGREREEMKNQNFSTELKAISNMSCTTSAHT